MLRRFFLERAAEPLAHFRGGGLGEGDDEKFVERRAFAVKAIQTTRDERVSFARASAGHDEHVAARGDGVLLRQRKSIFFVRRFHCSREFRASGWKFQVFSAGKNIYCPRMAESLRLKDQPVSERPRERLAALGADALSHAELIAIFADGFERREHGRSRQTAFAKVRDASMRWRKLQSTDLQKIKGIGRDKAVTLVAAFALARKMAADLKYGIARAGSSGSDCGLLREDNRLLKVETFQVVLLNTRRRLYPRRNNFTRHA